MDFGYFCTKANHFPIFINPPRPRLGALWRSTLASRNAAELFRKFKTFSLAVNHAAFDFVKQWLYWCWLRFMNDEVEDHLLSEAHNVALNKRLNKEEKAVWISDMLLIRSSNSRLRGCRSHDNDRCWMWDNNAHVAPHSVTFSHVENLSEELFTDQMLKTFPLYLFFFSFFWRLCLIPWWKINRHAERLRAGAAAGEGTPERLWMRKEWE